MIHFQRRASRLDRDDLCHRFCLRQLNPVSCTNQRFSNQGPLTTACRFQFQWGFGPTIKSELKYNQSTSLQLFSSMIACFANNVGFTSDEIRQLLLTTTALLSNSGSGSGVTLLVRTLDQMEDQK
jgi:hypothetical protein